MAFSDLVAVADRAVQARLGGVAVRYRPGWGRGEPVDVQGVFDAPYLRADVGQSGVVSSGPSVFLRLSDLPSDPEEDDEAVISVAGADYLIREPQKDGQGGVLLLLNRRP